MNNENRKEKSKPFGWCVIGAGRIANVVAKEITATNRHKIVSVFSRTQEKAKAFADLYNAESFDNLKSALNADGVEAVYIATPHSAHYKYILEAVENKKPILCEKAFTVNAVQAEKAVKAAEENGVYLAEAMWTRFNPVIKQIVKWIKDGEIGEIKHIKASFSLPLAIAQPFVSNRVYKPEYAGGALLDLGVYPIAYAHMILGYPDKTECRGTLKNNVDYDDKITLFYKNGAECELYCSFDKYRSYKSVITGSKGKIESPMFYKPNKAVLKNEKGKESAICKRGYIYEFDAAAEDIRQGKKENSLIPHKDTLEIMRIMDECRRQNGLVYPENIEKSSL